MPPRVKKAPPVDQLAVFDQRIKTAEVQYVLATAKEVGMSLESCELLVELIEMGEGREPDVLREALAIGLRAKKRIRTQHEEYEEDETNEVEAGATLPPPTLNGGPPAREGTALPVTLGGLAASVLGAGSSILRPGEEVLPPSQRRPRMETDGAEE